MSEMKAGRELDALVASTVMGFTDPVVVRRGRSPKSAGEKVAPMFRRFEVHAVDGSYIAQIEGGTSDVDCSYIADATADTAPLAICRAALAALEATCAK